MEFEVVSIDPYISIPIKVENCNGTMTEMSRCQKW
jgi:hypothetical protein